MAESIEDPKFSQYQLELKLVLKVLHEVHGYDFRNYALPTIDRRLLACLKQEKLQYISDLIPKILHEKGFAQRLVPQLAISVTDFFRDESFFTTIREKVFPILHTFPFFKIWHAGCASGEEVYSMAILLQEAGLLTRAHIYATDINHLALRQAKEGIYPCSNIMGSAERYQLCGGRHTLSSYFTTRYEAARVSSDLKKNITFANHNLAIDFDFAEMQLIICRNVLIYFNHALKERAINLFHSSLYPGGVLCLSDKENLTRLPIHDYFQKISATECIYKKVVNNYTMNDRHQH